VSYLDEINEIIAKIPTTLIDFDAPRVRARKPSQAASNFITNREQGDWAENVILHAINDSSTAFRAVKYGKSDDIIAGDDGFADFYESFQDELDRIGKRPDILLFKASDYCESLGPDISKYGEDIVDNYVKKAIAGLEIHSSSFLVNKYEQYMQTKVLKNIEDALNIKNLILTQYIDLLQNKNRCKYIKVLESITHETIDTIDFTVPGYNANQRLKELNDLFKDLKKSLKDIRGRSSLSITPKVEDLTVVNKWIQTFGVPHYYFQVFFDKVHAISFKDILSLLVNPDNEGDKYYIEGDVANQMKQVIKIGLKSTHEIAEKVEEPDHKSIRRELTRGQLLFYVTFEKGYTYLKVNSLKSVLGISEW